MSLRKYLSSLRSTYIFMACFGLLIGAVFPFYSWIFFGAKAFAPLYAFGCLAAGFIVGSFCYYVIKEALKLYVEQQLASLSRITGGNAAAVLPGKADQLQQLMECNEVLMNRVYLMVENVSRLAADISSRHGRLTGEFREMVTGNERRASRGKETLHAVQEMNRFFTDLMAEIEEIAQRTDERASLSTTMSSATDEVAANIGEYAALVMETSASIEQVATSIKETTASTQALTASTEKTCNSINIIGASIANVRDNARRSSECSNRAMAEADEGMTAMAATVAAMTEIERMTDSSVEAIRRLSLHSQRVGKFLEIIKDVVAQSTLLSLNASIIAAQAGEHGKAFAVVAEQVRDLAKRTSASAGEIEELVSNIQRETSAAEKAATEGKDKVAQGVAVSRQTSGTLKRIEESAAEAARMVQEIAAATDEQASASALITGESEKNLQRVRQLTEVIEQEGREAAIIVRSLDGMREFSRRIAGLTEEQARGNRLYMKSVLDDNAKVKKLKENCLQQIAMADLVRGDVNEVGRLMEANADEARKVLAEIREINESIRAIHAEMASFRQASLETESRDTPSSVPVAV